MNIVVGVIFLIFSGKITTTITESLGSNYITRYSEDNSIKAIYDTLQSQVIIKFTKFENISSFYLF